MGFFAALPAIFSAVGAGGAAAAGTAAAAGAAATAGTTAAWLGIAASGATVLATQQAANAQRAQLKVAQRQEDLAAGDREVQRQRRLNAILGSQNAEAAAKGVVNSGSIANISLKDAKRAAEDSLVDEVNTRNRIDALRAERASIKQSAWIRSAGTVLSAGSRYAARG